MNKLKLFLLTLFLFSAVAGCSVNKEFLNEHNAKNMLDWEGIYFGITPCADCPGIETTLTLNRNFTYKLSLVYQDRDVNPFIETGTFKFDESGNKIELNNGENGFTKYFVSENYIIQLDIDGNFIEGDLKDYFKLKKIVKNNLSGTNWKIKNFLGTRTDSLSYFINFSNIDQKFTAYFGCNNIMGTYEVKNDLLINFKDVFSTKKVCAEMHNEIKFLQVLETIDNYTFNNDTLKLNRAKMAPIIILERGTN